LPNWGEPKTYQHDADYRHTGADINTPLLLCAGLLARLSACLPAFAQHTQQQLAAGEAAAAGFTKILVHQLGSWVMSLLNLWHPSTLFANPALVPTVMRTVLPLVQQLQACGPQLLETAAAAVTRPAVHQLQVAFATVQQVIVALLSAVLDLKSTGELP
jgi:hypothetical protein